MMIHTKLLYFFIPSDQLKRDINTLFKMPTLGTSLVAQWLRIHLPMQGTRVRALVQEDPACRGATKPVGQLLSLRS